MSPSHEIARSSVHRRPFSPFESWVRTSLHDRFEMVSNENLPPEILLQFDGTHDVPGTTVPAAACTNRR
ncbi:hypothetical protein [Komagataeibacter sp. FNDCF1]|uniref:hypothetical protein n=1 Tax=Komagataeibacter sp. FNDCF1 TaxID=2878681 RepID=UPI001E3FEB5F|nr:hypothetical protein [Komagataeibacter sp. FNDCF1]MCE2565174.1 hypothetical protein [Komagataeibacter sp. FNDCF1]